MPEYVNLLPGDPAPWFYQRSCTNPRYAFHTAGGQYVVLCFFGSAADPHSQAAIAAVQSRPAFFNEATACFFGVSIDPDDEAQKRVANEYPGYEVFWDFDFTASRLYGAVSKDAVPKDGLFSMRRFWVVLDPMLRVMQIIAFQKDRSDIVALNAYLDGLPTPSCFAGLELPAPIILLPQIFEPEFCDKLIALHETHGGNEIGVMREVGGKTVGV